MPPTIDVKKIENNVIYETFGNHSRFELKNALAIGKFVIALQKFDDNNKQIAFISSYLDADEALVMANDIISGSYFKKAQKQPDQITECFKSLGGSNKDGEIIYRDITLSKGKLWMFKAQECPGKKTDTGGYAPAGKATTTVSVGVMDQAIKAIAIMIQSEYIAYRTAQILKQN